MRRTKVKSPVKDPIAFAIDAELIRRDSLVLPKDFRAFIREAWDKTEQYEFKNGYHIDAIAEHLQACAERQIKTLVINIPPRHGKLLADSTPVFTPTGWVRHGNLRVGDSVYHPSGAQTKVLAISEPDVANYKVTFSDGTSILAHGNHEWTVFYRPQRVWRTVETKWLADIALLSGKRCSVQLPEVRPLIGSGVGGPIDAYFLGVWLGDGRSSNIDFCFSEKDRVVFDEVQRRIGACSWSSVHKTTGVNYVGWKGFRSSFKELNLLGNKHIPISYLNANISTRLDLLAGLIDTDGSVDKRGRVRFVTVCPRLKDDFCALVRTFGWRPSVHEVEPSVSTSGIVGKKSVFYVGFQPTMAIPTKIPRKAIRRFAPKRRLGIVSVEKTYSETGRCIQVDADDGLYLAGVGLTPTHNSTLGSVMLPAWVLARDPRETLLYASYSEKLATRDSVKTRRLVESDWYKARFPNVAIEDDSNLKTAFITTAKGGRQCTSVGGTVTGMGGSWLVIDDPVNVKDAESSVVRESANQFFLESWYNRVEGDPNNAIRVVIMQRVHAQDVSAICHDLGWDSLVLPMEFEAQGKPTSIGWVDPRNAFGSLLWPEMWNTEAVAKQKKAMGSFAFAGQYQQRPVPRGGGVFKKEWLRFWFDPLIVADPPPVAIQLADGQFFDAPMKRWTPPEREYTNSWDMSFKGGANSDPVVGQAWIRENGFYLVDQERGRYDFPATLAAVRRLHDRRPGMPTLVEGKANGSAVISALSSEIPGMIEVNPEGGKEARAAAVAPLFEAGNVWLPHPAMYPWVQEYIDELCIFPRGQHDDQVDATTQALVRLREKQSTAVDLGSNFGGKVEVSDGLISESYWLSLS